MKPGKREKVIKILASTISEREYIRFAFLHGSFIETRDFHDIDVAVYFDTSISNEKRLSTCINLSTELTADLHFPVDINDLNGASLSFAYYASCGEILYYRDLEEVYDYKEDIWIKYADFYPFLKQNLLDLLDI
ncbi:MAG: nucleotidyltransferase domain-containing protein [Clostridiales bacterium]|nr:nucleotidyltransferase domain-containing protein [Clostridiales bacterium]MCF8023734.1 nucleotidyltransferase domain-containing protein [Clostridiales bacterium]